MKLGTNHFRELRQVSQDIYEAGWIKKSWPVDEAIGWTDGGRIRSGEGTSGNGVRYFGDATRQK